ncbi:DUF5318 family protein [Tessaracoccus oleiagri]|uniref:DUF5318 domain-containing protein n=1 Tax=Tessaracoccus oleiagri TaxID=686624 RepID=A0A1G9I2D8_9ACTN|nr:DUF5318 family protein [Tessaracoccus oleiagri]SDL19074.1 hypothetical protein SAMN04488242_0667 [Tessaracoccus oleiagri]
MWSKREVIDYALQRRASLERLQRVPPALRDFDAHPLLIRSALHHGEESGRECPVCGHLPLLNLNYVFGEQLGQFSGRIKSTAELDEMQSEFGEFRVCVVEVCTECEWNHMVLAYLLGDGKKRKPPRRRRTVEDIYG